jgi:tetratricopeptide (TPR) repeat protein
MKFWFCEQCGNRITDDDMASGKAAETESHGVCCARCLESRKKIQLRPTGSQSGARRTTALTAARPTTRTGSSSSSEPTSMWPYIAGSLGLVGFTLIAITLSRSRPEAAQIIAQVETPEPAKAAQDKPAPTPQILATPVAAKAPVSERGSASAESSPRRDGKQSPRGLFALTYGGEEPGGSRHNPSAKGSPVADSQRPAAPPSAAPVLSPELNALMQRALELERLNDLQGALACYDEGIKKQSDFAEMYSNRGNIRLSLNDYRGALSDAESALRIKKFWNAWAVKAIACAVLGHVVDYKNALNEAVAAVPAAQRKQMEAAIDASAQRSIREMAGSKLEEKQPQSAEEFLARGQFRIKQQRNKEALADFEAAVEHDPSLAEKGIYSAMAELAERQGDHKTKLDYYQRWMKAQPTLPDAINAVAWELLTSKDESLRNPSAALPLVEKANALTRESNPGILDTYAMALAKSGRKSDAVATQKKALAMLPKDIAPTVRQEFEQHLRDIETD